MGTSRNEAGERKMGNKRDKTESTCFLATVTCQSGHLIAEDWISWRWTCRL